MFRGATDPITLLKPPSPEEAVPPALIKACIAAKRAHADRTLLQNFLGSFKHPNKTSLCGIYRLALGLNPARSSHLLVCMDIARWTQREQLKDKFEREVEIMFDFFDKVFVANFLAGKLKALDFAKLHAKVLELVLDGDTLSKVLCYRGGQLRHDRGVRQRAGWIQRHRCPAVLVACSSYPQQGSR